MGVLTLALSNWAIAAWDERGMPVPKGAMEFQGGRIEIYKNWVRIELGDKKIELTEGHIELHPAEGRLLEVRCREGKQNGVYLHAAYFDRGRTAKILMGIGCYGYERVPVSARACFSAPLHIIRWLAEKVLFERGYSGFGERLLFKLTIMDFKTLGKLYEGSWDEVYVGVKKGTFNDFIRWIHGLRRDFWIDVPRIRQSVAFNQGDVYFSESLSWPLRAQVIGRRAPPPYLHVMLDKVL